ncbi:FecR domain-containing protein [Mucilaginibacter flavus]|nr:FecR domain-containing protein [Mucilaginibacter flavus]
MDEHHYLLIIAYLEGRSTEQETQYLLQKVQEEAAFSEAFEDIAEIWSARKPVPDQNTEANDVLASLNLKIDALEHSHSNTTEEPVAKRGATIVILKRVIAIAAMLVCMLGAVLFYNNTRHNNAGAGTMLAETHTGVGQKRKIKLPDGTEVMLNSSSSLHVAAAFGSDKREVYLDGEAWFDVKRDPQKPFIVHTGQVATQVLGTHFNVSAYQSDSNIVVSLVQGKVQVDMDNDLAKRVILDPGKQMTYSKSAKTAKVTEFLTEDITGWKENKLVFDYDSWPDAAKKLSRWYGVPVQLKNGELLRCKLKGTFNNMPLTKVLQQISMVSDISWITEGKKVVISGKCN